MIKKPDSVIHYGPVIRLAPGTSLEDLGDTAAYFREKSTFHGRLKSARESKGLTQSELAARIEKSRPTVAAYENDTQPNLEVIARIAGELNVEPNVLAFGIEAGESPSSTGPQRAIPIIKATDGETCNVGNVTLPEWLATDLGLPEMSSSLAQIALDAPEHKLKAGSWVFVDASESALRPDGALYAILSGAGAIAIRTVIALVANERPRFVVDGNGKAVEVDYEQVRSLGRIKGSLDTF